MLVVALSGFLVVSARAALFGRPAPVAIGVVVFVLLMLLAVWAHVHRIRVLRSLSTREYRLVGWTLAWFRNADVLRCMAGGADGRQASTAVVGVFLTPVGITLRLHLPERPNVALTAESEMALGYRGRSRWLLLATRDGQVALRIHRVGTSTARFDRIRRSAPSGG